MMLGKLRPEDAYTVDPHNPPRPSTDYLPINTTPLPGQNVMRQVVMNGVMGLGGIGMLGATPAAGDTGDTAAPQSVAASYAAMPMWWKITYGTLVTASGALSLYHGYRRNNSLGWGLGWFALGTLFPVITPTVAFAQGFAKRKGR